MYHDESIVDQHTLWVKGKVSKLEAFANICPILANQFIVSAFALRPHPSPPRLQGSGPARQPRPTLAHNDHRQYHRLLHLCSWSATPCFLPRGQAILPFCQHSDHGWW